MLEYGTVTKVRGKIATVRIGRHSACGSCGMCGVAHSQKYADFQTINTLQAKVGDTVKIDIKAGNAAKIAAVAYLIPLVLGLALFVLGVLLKLPDWANLLMFLGGCAIAFVIVWAIDKRKKHKWMESPELLEIVSGKTADEALNEQIAQSQSDATK